MKIGIRAFPDSFSYVILDGTQQRPTVVTYDRLKYPKGASWAASLSWLRKEIEEVIARHHDITGACIKTTEPIAQKKSKERNQAEGVIVESLYSIAKIECRLRIKSQLKKEIKEFKDPARYLKRVLKGAAELKELNTPNFEESALAAISELEPE